MKNVHQGSSAGPRRLRRVGRLAASILSATGLALMAVAATGMAVAGANAANPLPTTTGTAILNADGSVAVQLNGTWSWPGQACSGRYGEGWAVDWWGISTSTGVSPSFSLTSASEVTAPGTTTTGTVSPAGSIAIGNGTYFHVGQYYAGEVVNSTSTCTDSGSGGSAISSGTWTASATYPSQSDMPAQLCVNFYDEHGQEGKASNSSNDYSPVNDNDNSIKTNKFNPASGGGYCTSPPVVNAGMLAGHIYQCNSGIPSTTEVPGGTLAATGPTTVTAISNPLAPQAVTAGTYAMTATAPATYVFVSCGGSATIGSPATTATEAVVVPTNKTGTGIFYVQVPLVAPSSLAGHIYLCDNGTATTTEVANGTLSATGPQTVAAVANPLAPQTVTAGTYTMAATAPASYLFVSCGGPATIGSPATTANEPVVVPTGGIGTGVFYVTPVVIVNNPTITLSVTKANDANGSGTYAQSEESDSPGAAVPFRVVVTNTSSVSVTLSSLTDSWPGQTPFPAACDTALVGTTLAAGASATCNFTLAGYAPAAGSSLTDTVVVTGCQASASSNCGQASSTSTVLTIATTASQSLNLSVTKANDANGSGTYAQSETASGPDQNVTFQVVVTNNSPVAVTISSLSDAWPGASPFSPTCSGALVGTTLAVGASAVCYFSVDGYSPAAGSSVTNTVTVVACQQSKATNCGTWPATSVVQTAAVATAASSGGLAFTGAPAHLQLMLELGFAMLSAGAFMLWFARPRRQRRATR